MAKEKYPGKVIFGCENCSYRREKTCPSCGTELIEYEYWADAIGRCYQRRKEKCYYVAGLTKEDLRKLYQDDADSDKDARRKLRIIEQMDDFDMNSIALKMDFPDYDECLREAFERLIVEEEEEEKQDKLMKIRNQHKPLLG